MDSDGGRRKSAKRALQIEKKDEITETPVPRNETKEGAELSTYELERNLRVAENHEMLQSLGIEPRAVQHGQRKRVRNSITSEFHQDGPRTRSRSDPGAPGAAAHQEQQHNSSSSSASGPAAAAADRSAQTRVKRRAHIVGAHSFLIGQTVWARDPLHGECWWPATVSVACPLKVTWESPQGFEPLYEPSDFENVRSRPLCGCGSCTADMLPDDRALQDHESRVNACINQVALRTRMKEIQNDANRWSPTPPHRTPFLILHLHPTHTLPSSPPPW